MINKRSIRSGFVLTELLIATGIFLAIAAVVYGTYIQGMDISNTTQIEAELNSQAKNALTRMVEELRSATRTSAQNPSPNANIVTGPNQRAIHFNLPADEDDDGLLTDEDGVIEWDTNNQIKFEFIRGQRDLRRHEKGDSVVFAEEVSDVEFDDVTTDSSLGITEIRITLTLSRDAANLRNPIAVTRTAVVSLRN